MKTHFLVKTDFQSFTATVVQDIIQGKSVSEFQKLLGYKGAVFSSSILKKYLVKEERHGIKKLPTPNNQALVTMSSGEQKKALLSHIIAQQPDFLILVDPFDHLDIASSRWFKGKLVELSEKMGIVQFSNRMEDLLPIPASYYVLQQQKLQAYPSRSQLKKAVGRYISKGFPAIPAPLKTTQLSNPVLVKFKEVSVHFLGKAVLHQIDWTIKQGTFWQLTGPNGSGKSTLLSMITGDSHKGYGQDLQLFGRQKGSGESVWDIKKNIGYFTPAMTTRFKGNHSLEHMLISGLHDSVGLYIKPSETERQLAHTWLKVLGLWEKRSMLFHQISEGEQRLVMTARAMIKHPPLLILDEPTIGLDDDSAHFFVQLVNHYAKASSSALLYVSHRKEPELQPNYVLQLVMGANGSIGKIW